jgi:molybdopterin molybdotransferase
MITVQEAKNLLQKHLIRGLKKNSPLLESLGFFLAEDIFAPIDIPSFDNSAMDGYALSWSSEPTRKLKQTIKIQAGDPTSTSVSSEEAVRIFTGAPLPHGTDTVIPQEWVVISSDRLTFDPDKFKKGSNARLRGAQNKKGDRIATAGTLITPGMVSLLASVGFAEVAIYKQPSVAVILTGNELQQVGQPLAEGKIYDANGPVLKAYLNQLGIDVANIFFALDEPEALNKLIVETLNSHDILLLSGGISVGDYDFVKSGLLQAGVEELFYKVRQKPGKPLFVGQLDREKWIFALPGNPASTLTCFNQYVKPCIQAWLGQDDTFKPQGTYPLVAAYAKPEGLTFFLKAKVEHEKVHILPGQESFNLISYGMANCFVEVDEQTTDLSAGNLVNVYYW